jgi:hypothetical protein
MQSEVSRSEVEYIRCLVFVICIYLYFLCSVCLLIFIVL